MKVTFILRDYSTIKKKKKIDLLGIVVNAFLQHVF